MRLTWPRLIKSQMSLISILCIRKIFVFYLSFTSSLIMSRPIFLSLCLSISLSLRFTGFIDVYLSVCRTGFCLSICLSLFVSVFLSVCLCLSISISFRLAAFLCDQVLSWSKWSHKVRLDASIYNDLNWVHAFSRIDVPRAIFIVLFNK